MLQIKTLPSRSRQYVLQAHVDKEGGHANVLANIVEVWDINTNGLVRDWSMIKLVRDLSNLSVQFRQEVGNIIWANTKINFPIERYGGWSSLEPLAFLFERPAMHKGIKSLQLNIPRGNIYGDEISHFKVTCQYLSTILELTHLRIMINGDISDVKEMTRGSDKYSGIEITRLIKVKKSFEVSYIYQHEMHLQCTDSARILA